MLPTRDQDRPPADGRMRRACLSVLAEPASVRDVAIRLSWDRARAHSWVHWLRRMGYVERVEWFIAPSGQRAGRYRVRQS